MTTAISAPERAPRQRTWSFPVVLIAIAVTVVLRVIQFRAGASPDEGGFLMLGSQWQSHGGYLYGHYWVDRPPLLITLFSIADLFGGVPALRIIGILIAALTIVLLASTARRLIGRTAANWTAVAAAALLATPLYGAIDVNGELFALPFIALGIWMATETVLVKDVVVSRASALFAGMAAVAALLVKQNIADVIVFAAVFWILSWRLKNLTLRELVDRIALAAAGALITYAVVMLWAMAHGTSPIDVYDATYPFRVQAAKVIAENPGINESAGMRLGDLGNAFLLTGVPLIIALFLARGVHKATSVAFSWAVVALMGWGTFSVLAGGSYWRHYFVESIPAIALAVGAIALATPRLLRGVVTVVTASAIVAAAVAAVQPSPTPGTTIGEALHAVSEPGDTAFSAFGDAEVVHASGLTSPYPYLWSLPARTLDPKLDLLREVVAGPAAPTWIVVRGAGTTQRLADGGVLAVMKTKYRELTRLCDRDVYLLDTAERDVPVAAGQC